MSEDEVSDHDVAEDDKEAEAAVIEEVEEDKKEVHEVVDAADLD